MTIMLIVAVILLLAVGFYFYSKKSEENEDVSEVKEKVTEERFSVEKSIESVLNAEEKFALENLAGVSLNNELKNTCDVIYEALPEILKEFPNTEIAFKTYEIANKNLPDKVETFISLDENTQKERSVDFTESLKKFKAMIEKANDVIKQTNLSKDERESLLIGIKY